MLWCALAWAVAQTGDAPRLQDPHAKQVTLSPKDDLPRAVSQAASGTTLLLQDGTYRVGAPLHFRAPDVWLRSASGKRDKVLLDGLRDGAPLKRDNCTGELLLIQASNVTIADVTLRHARDHAVHVSPVNRTLENARLYNLHIYDCGQQLVKVNSNGGDPAEWVDRGAVEYCLIEFQDTSIMQDLGGSFYTGGIDVHGGRGWTIRRNTFRNIQRDAKSMEHAVHMWSGCRDTIVEANRFEDCHRAVGFGMKKDPEGLVRRYEDVTAAYFDHVGGVIRNNMIFNRRGVHLEAGIELMNVIEVEVDHNTVASVDKPFSSIEYRWPNTRVKVRNNLMSHNLMPRDGARAEAASNLENAPASLFRGFEKGDLRLARGAAAAVDKGVPLKSVPEDFEGDRRDLKPDLGADEAR